MNALELKIPPPILALLAGAAMWALSESAPSLAWQIPYVQVFALTLVVLGGAIAFAGVMSFRRSRTTVNPLMPQNASSLVTSGIYRVSRNPMYLGFILVLVGWAVYLTNVLSLLPVVAFVIYMNRFQISLEERALTSLFGTEFNAYQQSVRRWL